jgi:hypothetical protein
MSSPMLFVDTDRTRSVELRAEKPRQIYVDMYQSVGRTPYLSSRMSFPLLLVGTGETRSVGLRVKRPGYIYAYVYQHVGPDM